MVNGLNLILLAVLLLPLCWKLRRDYVHGLAYALFLCVSMSTFIRVPLPAGLPQLTIFRLILVLLFLFWFLNPDYRRGIRSVPFIGYFAFWAVANLFSLLFTSIDFVTSLKDYLDFVLEVMGFYLIVATTVRTRPEALKLLHAAALGLGLVAIFAWVEKYNGFNFVDYIMPPEEADTRRMISATYQHRILLGTGMAMGLPLVFALINQPDRVRGRKLLWGIVLLLCGAAYFAQSRGPWLAAVLGGAVLFYYGTPALRRRLVWVPLLAAVVLLARPGVYETFVNYAQTTTDKDSFKGRTFMYRLELWKIAWDRITESPTRFLVGYGPGCGTQQSVEWDLSYSGRTAEITSWDNHYAYDLFQSGVLGFLARVALYLAVLRAILRNYRRADEEDRDFHAALLASACILLFMMSNVLIFSKQLNFLFWTLAAISAVRPVVASEESVAPADTDDLKGEALAAQRAGA